MNPHPHIPEAKSTDHQSERMRERLRALRSHSVGDCLLMITFAAGALFFAWIQGYEYFMISGSLLMVIFSMYTALESRANRQAEFFIQLLTELRQDNLNESEQIG